MSRSAAEVRPAYLVVDGALDLAVASLEAAVGQLRRAQGGEIALEVGVQAARTRMKIAAGNLDRLERGAVAIAAAMGVMDRQ